MKKILIFVVIFLLIQAGYLLVSNFLNDGPKRYDSVQEAIEKEIDNDINEVIHTEQRDGVNVVMYTIDPEVDNLPEADFEALAIAFLKGNDENGWKNLGSGGWTHYDNENMRVYVEPLRIHEHHFHVVFGEINNPAIAVIETKADDEKSFEKAGIITHRGERYYFQPKLEPIVRGLAENGDIVDRQGG
ncbi:hypothetical protein [Salimicrobium halophilum]|uniref:Uncharacterized protein n=1 Tax=Salimicrobium halophilum TaxID=86666 RepID=A0A1G8RG15_9BACI|nr:hypothetical protein [Salimicrobium halophilum]SDJ15957.1 hypothetical protein SAMN04490247_1013 [Salimicrobium halophilum]